MNILKTTTALMLGITLSFVAPAFCDLSISKEKASWEIVMPAGSPDSVHLAARELKHYIARSLGVEIPIVNDRSSTAGKAFYLGASKQAKSAGIDPKAFRPDGFRLLSVADGVVISGIDYDGPPMTGHDNPYRINESYNSELKISAFGNTGTLQGVYEFLRRFVGVRWYMPGELGEVVPTKDSLDLPEIDLALAPVFEQRYAYFCFFESSPRDALWYKRLGYGTPAPVEITHSLGRLFIKYQETNPEFFALVNGQRDFTTLSTVMGPGNFNLTHPDFIDQVVRDINLYFDENPNSKVFPLGPNDGMRKISEDPESQAQIDLNAPSEGRFSNYVWGFVNKVATEVAKKHPDRIIGCIAYEHYNLPPTNIDKLSPNVAVVICKFRRDLSDPLYEKNLAESIRQWSEKASVLYTWEYYCDILLNPGWRGYPVFYPLNVQKDLKALVGVTRGEFIEAESWTPDQYVHREQIRVNYPGLQHPLLYVTARLLWDPEQELDALLNEYYDLFYEAAAEPMKAFWQEASETWMASKSRRGPAEVYSPKTLARLVAHLEKATALVADDSAPGKRISMIRSEFLPASEQGERLQKVMNPSMDVARADGHGGEEIDFGAWENAGMQRLIDRSFKPADPATHLRVMATPEELRFLIINFEPKMENIRSSVEPGEEGRVWEDDSIELFVCPEGSNATVHLIVNAKGALFDQLNETDDWAGGQPAWNSNAKVISRKEANRWLVEIRIPWASFGREQGEITEFRGNLYRNRFASGVLEQQSWAPMLSGFYYNPEAFGRWRVKSQ